MRFLKVKSISDVITNSSTEVFLIKDTDDFRKMHKASEFHKAFHLFEFKTEEDIKKQIMEDYHNKELGWFDEFFEGENPLGELSEVTEDWEDPMFEREESDDWLWNKYKEHYMPLLGYVLCEIGTEFLVRAEDDALNSYKKLSLERHFW